MDVLPVYFHPSVRPLIPVCCLLCLAAFHLSLLQRLLAPSLLSRCYLSTQGLLIFTYLVAALNPLPRLEAAALIEVPAKLTFVRHQLIEVPPPHAPQFST